VQVKQGFLTGARVGSATPGATQTSSKVRVLGQRDEASAPIGRRVVTSRAVRVAQSARIRSICRSGRLMVRPFWRPLLDAASLVRTGSHRSEVQRPACARWRSRVP